MNALADVVSELAAVIAATAPLDAEPVTAADVMRASGGLFPDRRAFTPAVPAATP